MKKIEIKKLRIENFKGCIKRAINFEDVTSIFGANATGKTTIMDACMWLLFDKDSTGATKFNIRPLDSAGNMIDNVEILVEAELFVDGTPMVLQKVQKQNWVKKRGTDITTLQGNVNTYEINSFPVSEKEFKEKIESIISEELFKLLTDPRAFANLPWKKQREILLKFISEITDADVLETDPTSYVLIADEVRAAPVEKCIEKAKKAMAKLKDRQKELPARIDEASRSLVQVADLAELELQRNALNEQLVEVQKQRDDTGQVYKAVADIQSEIVRVQSEIRNIHNQAEEQLRKTRNDAQREFNKLESDGFDIFERRQSKEREVKRLQTLVDEMESKRTKLGDEYKAAKAMTMEESETVCKFCGQELPADRIEQISAEFEDKKKSIVNQILADGRDVKNQIDTTNDKITKLNEDIEALKQQWDSITAEKNKAMVSLNAIPATADISDNQEYQALQVQLSNLQSRLGNMDTGEGYKQQLSIREKGIREELDAVNMQFAAIDANNRVQERISELKDEQKVIGQKVADQEQKIYLLEQFSRAKMDMLANGINSQFQMVNFKLFEMQINGGIKDTCEMTVGGVPYSSLNSAAKMQAGLDVIQSLSRLYGVSVPVWLDNRESVSEIPEVDCQVINLFVSPADKTLRIEVA